jgi:riboflavin synthase
VFTGIIQHVGRIDQVIELDQARSFWIEVGTLEKSLQIGDSLAVNGVCLTIEEKKSEFSLVKVTAISQTLSLSNLGRLKNSSAVNCETAATINTALGGHMVAGHVDGCAQVSRIEPKAVGLEIWLDFPSEFLKYLVVKGSVALDGVSLTIAEISEHSLKVALIPETLEKTILSQWNINDLVNFEVDPIGKYVENFLTRAGYVKNA